MIDILIKIVQMKIITNIAAGLILFFIFRMIFEWQNERRQVKAIELANQHIKSLLGPYTAGGKFPAMETFDSVISSVARDYGIGKKDLYPISFYFQEFTREILENPLIPQDKKIEYTDNLRTQLIAFKEHPWDAEPADSANSFEDKKNKLKYNSQMNLSALFAGVSVLLVALISNTYALYECLSIFAVTTFVLLIFAEFAIKRRRYRDVPKFMDTIRTRFTAYQNERKNRKARNASVVYKQFLAEEQTSDSQEPPVITEPNTPITPVANTVPPEIAPEGIIPPDLDDGLPEVVSAVAEKIKNIVA